MIEMTSRQRKYLEKSAVEIQPIVIIGQNGVTPSLTEKIRQTLECHELIKVKFNEFKDDKQNLTEKICSDCDASLVRIIGNVAVLFRQNDDEKKRIYNIKNCK